MTDLVGEASAIAERLMARELPRRWGHVRAVAAKAVRTTPVVPGPDRDVLVAAAWLHDIGYVKPLVDTGFHPLDGARWLRAEGFDRRVVSLVANHSCAVIEADERGLAVELVAEFPHEPSVIADSLWYCDMTTGPDGQDFEVTERLAEIKARYGPEDVVTRFVRRAEPEIVGSVRRTEQRLRELDASVQPR